MAPASGCAFAAAGSDAALAGEIAGELRLAEPRGDLGVARDLLFEHDARGKEGVHDRQRIGCVTMPPWLKQRP